MYHLKKFHILNSSPDFKGSFTGLDTFRTHLMLEKNLKVSKKTILEAFQEIPSWAMSLKKRRKFRRRTYMATCSNDV